MFSVFVLSKCVCERNVVSCEGCLAAGNSAQPCLSVDESRTDGRRQNAVSVDENPPFFFFFLRRQIKKEYGSNVVPSFPPKKIFTLTLAEVEQRREQLEKYMQAGQLLIGIKNRSSQYCFSLAF